MGEGAKVRVTSMTPLEMGWLDITICMDGNKELTWETDIPLDRQEDPRKKVDPNAATKAGLAFMCVMKEENTGSGTYIPVVPESTMVQSGVESPQSFPRDKASNPKEVYAVEDVCIFQSVQYT